MAGTLVRGAGVGIAMAEERLWAQGAILSSGRGSGGRRNRGFIENAALPERGWGGVRVAGWKGAESPDRGSCLEWSRGACRRGIQFLGARAAAGAVQWLRPGT